MPGYHLREIPRGEFGTPSKIREEFEEFMDALDQGNRIMALVELSDLLGAIEGYVEQEYGMMGLDDLIKMKVATQRAFIDGTRTSRFVKEE